MVAFVPSPSGYSLKQLDARTLRPVRGGWSRAVRKYAATALSPSGSRIAVAGSGGTVLVLNAVTGQSVRNYRDAGGAFWIYWLGGDGTVRSGPELLVAQSEGCSSGGCGPEYTVVGSGVSIGLRDYPEAEAARKDGLVLASEPTQLVFFGRDASYVAGYFSVELPRMPRSAPFGVVIDVAHDRVYAISSAGLVAEISRIDLTPRSGTTASA